MQFNTSFHLQTTGPMNMSQQDPGNQYSYNQFYYQNLQPNISSNMKQTFTNRFQLEENEHFDQTSYKWNGSDRVLLPQGHNNNSNVNTTAHMKNELMTRPHSGYMQLMKHNNYLAGNTVNVPTYHHQYSQEPLQQYQPNTEEWMYTNYGSSNNQVSNDSYKNSQQLTQPMFSTSDSKQNLTSIPSTHISFYDQELLETAKRQSLHSLKHFAMQIKELDKQIEQLSESGKSKEFRSIQLEKKRKSHLFALICLFKTFRISPNSVCPRNVVYLKYVEQCKALHIVPICNAAFGKLVKVYHPGIKTRRLGVRGSSRYNYCGIELISKVEITADPNCSDLLDANKEGPAPSSTVDANNFNDSDKYEKSITSVHVPRLQFLVEKNRLTFEEHISAPEPKDLIDSNIKESHKEILKKYVKYASQMILDFRKWDIASFLTGLKSFSFQSLLSKKMHEIYENDIDQLLKNIIKVDVYVCRQILILTFKHGLYNHISSMRPELETFKTKISEIFDFLNLKDTILEEKQEVAQKVLKTISSIEKTFTLFDLFVKCFKNQDDVDQFFEIYISTNFGKLTKQTSCFEESFETESSDFFKSLGMCISCLSFKIDETGSFNIASVYSAFRIAFESFENLINKLKSMSTSDILLQLNTSGMLLLQDILIESQPNVQQTWMYFIAWINAYFTLLAQLGSFSVECDP